MYVCMYVCTYVCMYVSLYVCMYVCMYVLCIMYVRLCVPQIGKFSPLKYFRPHTERQKLNMRKIKTHITRYVAEPSNDEIFLMQKFKGQIIFKVKIS